MPQRLRSVLASLTFAVAIGAYGGGSARGQQAPADPATPAPASSSVPTAPSDMHLIANLDPSLRIDRLKDALVAAAAINECKFTGEPKIRPMSRDAINEIFPGLIPEEGPTATVSNKSVSIGRIPSLKPMWELRMTDEESLIKSMEVKFVGGGEPLKLKPGFSKTSLVMTRPGYYSLELAAEKTPESFSLELGKIDGTQLPPVTNVPWPMTERYYSIQLLGFTGDLSRMLESMKTLTNKVHPVQGPAKQYSFASFSANPPRPGSTTSPTEYTAVVEGLGPENPATRVWILFPLTKETYAAALDKYKDTNARELSKQIRSESPSNATETAPTMKADVQPRWIELTSQDGGLSFKRSMPIEDLAANFAKYPELWYLTAWEAGDGDQAEVFYVQGQQGTGSGSYSVVANQDRKWSEVVPKLLGEKAKDASKSDK